MLLEILKNCTNDETAAILFPIVFVILFLVIGGGSLWLTPLIAAWLDKNQKKNKSFYDGMLEEDPNASASEDKEAVKEGEE